MTAGVFAVVGLVAGLGVEYLLRRWGAVRREIQSWVGSSRGGLVESRGFEATFFNDKDVNISLWNPKVEFRKDGRLLDTVDAAIRGRGPAGPIDLPSRTSVEVTMYVEAERGSLELLRSADQVLFVASPVPRGKKLEEPLKLWDDE